MKPFYALAIAVFALLGSAAARADDAYYIEIGKESSEEEALKNWQTYNEQQHAILKDLQFFPVTVIKLDRSVSTHVQAGPVATKKEAQKLCDKLFKKDVPCFVVEGANHTAPHIELAKREEEKPLAPKVALPWLSSPVSTETAQTVDAPGKVEVAEAIHVPLSDEEEKPQFTATQNADIQPAIPGWLNVDSFASADEASEFWDQVRAALPNLAAGLRVRTLTPATRQAEPIITLNIGPFATRLDAMNFCRNGIKVENPALRCGFTRSEAPSELATAQPVQSHHSDRYAERRQELRDENGAGETKAADNAPYVAPAGKVYWLLVASAGSEMEALSTWEKLRSENSDLLEGIRSSVSASLSGEQYDVRIGPLPSRGDANGLCKNLQARHIDCRIFSNSN